MVRRVAGIRGWRTNGSLYYEHGGQGPGLYDAQNQLVREETLSPKGTTYTLDMLSGGSYANSNPSSQLVSSSANVSSWQISNGSAATWSSGAAAQFFALPVNLAAHGGRPWMIWSEIAISAAVPANSRIYCGLAAQSISPPTAMSGLGALWAGGLLRSGSNTAAAIAAVGTQGTSTANINGRKAVAYMAAYDTSASGTQSGYIRPVILVAGTGSRLSQAEILSHVNLTSGVEFAGFVAAFRTGTVASAAALNITRAKLHFSIMEA